MASETSRQSLIISLNSAHQHRVKGQHSNSRRARRKMPISAQEWRVRTGLINASRIRTVSVFRSSKSTASAANHADSAPGSHLPGGKEIIAWNGQSAPPQLQVSRREGDSALSELPSSTWMGWKALLLCLLAPLIPKLITVLITICHILIGRLHAVR